MDVGIDKLPEIVKKMKPGGTLLVAPDVHDQLVAGQILTMDELTTAGVVVRRSPELGAGKVVVMYSAELKAPAAGWAGQFLNKSGPVPTGVVSPYMGKYAAAPVQPPQPPPAPKPPSAPKPPTSPVSPTKPRPRQRIIDT
jgi:LasA protease